MSYPKQVIVMRRDLNMRKGKMVAQGAHAAMKVLLDGQISTCSNGCERVYEVTEAMRDWLEGNYTKVCCSVDSEAELDAVFNDAKEAGISCSMIVDKGLTEFNGVATKTCIAIGPDYPERIDHITGHLKLL